jgi:hypothetical protein
MDFQEEEEEIQYPQLKIISKFKVFTEYEFNSAINCFETNFEELAWALENLKEFELYSTLVRIKLEYQIRYLEKGEFSRFSHVYKLLMHFLENAIFQNSEHAKNVKSNLIVFFEDIFNNRKDARNILEKLLEKKFIEKGNGKLKWHKSGRNTGKQIALLFKYLCQNDFIKPDYIQNYKAIVEIFNETFGLNPSTKTYQRAFSNHLDYNTSQFNFLGKPL